MLYLPGLTHTVHPQSLTWNLNMMVSKKNLLFQGLIFRFHVKLQGCYPTMKRFWSYWNIIMPAMKDYLNQHDVKQTHDHLRRPRLVGVEGLLFTIGLATHLHQNIVSCTCWWPTLPFPPVTMHGCSAALTCCYSNSFGGSLFVYM